MDGADPRTKDDVSDALEGASSTASTPVTGHLAGVDDEGRVLFVAEGSTRAIPVAIGMPLSDAAIVEAASRQARALVSRTGDPSEKLVLVGLVRDRVRVDAAKRGGLDATVDGEVVRIEAAERIELVCGKASIVLEADGHVTISGTHVVSASRGPNKIKGTTVSLN